MRIPVYKAYQRDKQKTNKKNQTYHRTRKKLDLENILCHLNREEVYT
jgi:hypothetical protein